MNKRMFLILAMSASAASLAGCASDQTKGSSPGGASGEVLVVPPPNSTESGATTAPANPPTVIIVPVEPQETPPSGGMGGSAPGGTSEQWRDDFRQLDANGDGLIDQNEAQGDVNFSALFGRLDMNGDGVISPSEYEAMHSGSGAGAGGGEGGSEPPDAVIVPGPAVIVPQEEPSAGASAGGSESAGSGTGYTFQQLDGDNDTQIDKQEARQYPPLSDNFDQADVNKDNVITGSEYDAWSQSQGQPSGGGAGAGSAGGASGGGSDAGYTFQQLDGDNDTQIDKQEARQYPSLSDEFDQADVNKDNVITGSEYDAWVQQQGG